MAQIPVEIIKVGQLPNTEIDQAISIANSLQDEFIYTTMSPVDARVFKMLTYERATARNLLDLIEERRSEIRGYHPFVITIVDAELDGKIYTNLFGSHRAKKGLAILTIANVENIVIAKERMAAYFLYYFARYTLSFITPDHRNHEESKGCIFDRKALKTDVVRSMKARAICDDCRTGLLAGESTLTPAQFEALDKLFEMSGKVLRDDTTPSMLLRGNTTIVDVDDSSLIKILFLAANPVDTIPLRLDGEMRAIDLALQQAAFRNRFDIKQQWAVRVTDLQHYLLRHQPSIVHFSGHGSALSEIVLEDASGNSRPVSVRALSGLFSVLKDNIKCVVLNACYSEPQAQAIAQSIDCVVGMSKAIGDDSAIGFATAFYQALGFGRDVKTAFDLGCIQIDLEGLGEQDTPKLLAMTSPPENIVFVKQSR